MIYFIKVVWRGLKRRWLILRFWFYKTLISTLRIPSMVIDLGEILKVVFGLPAILQGKWYVKSITLDADKNYIRVILHNLTDALLYPQGLPVKNLMQVIVESYDKQHWHYYEIPQ